MLATCKTATARFWHIKDSPGQILASGIYTVKVCKTIQGVPSSLGQGVPTGFLLLLLYYSQA